MLKKICAIFIALMMMLNVLTIQGATLAEKRLWTDGTKYTLDIPSKFEVSDTKKIEFLLPIYSDSVTIKTNTPGAVINFNIDGVENIISLPGVVTKYKFPEVVRLGEKDLYITGNAVLTEIVFNEITEEKSLEMVKMNLDNYNDALKTALVMREGSSLLKSRTAVRYFDYNNLEVKPMYFNGVLYAPADALALALEIYWEEDKSEDFFVLRREQTEIFRVNGVIKIGQDNIYQPYSLDVREFYGKTYIPIRQVAEAFGKYVQYKDGFVIIDYRSRAKDIANRFIPELKNEFSQYINDGTKGNTYYVSQAANASDENDGSKEHPWASISHANRMAKTGDTVVIGEGTWYETIKPVNDGTPTAPITFMAEEGDNVYLSATQVINNFTNYKDGLLVAAVPKALPKGQNQVFYKKQNLIEGRYPNPEVGEDGLFEYSGGIRLNPVWITEGDLKVSQTDSTKVHSGTLLQEPEKDYWKDAYFVSMHHYAWSFGMAKVESSKKGELSLKDMSTLWWWTGTDGINKGYLTCHINCIDQPGEWTITDGLLYILPPKGETKDTLELEVKNKQLVADLNDRAYVHLKGFKTFGGGIRMKDANMCVINGCDMKYISHYTYLDRNASLSEGGAEKGNDIQQRGEVGIYLGGENCAVVNSKIQYSAGSGIIAACTNAFVDNNVIMDVDYMGSSTGAGITGLPRYDAQKGDITGGQTITHNTVKRTSRSSLTWGGVGKAEEYEVGEMLPLEIAYNEFVDDSISSLDTGTVYTHGTWSGHELMPTRAHNNFTYETYTSNPAVHAGFYYDNWSNCAETFDNVQFAAKSNQYMYVTPVEQTKRVFPMSYATVDSWNNTDLGLKQKEELTINDFPSTKPFQVGSSLLDDKHNLTYEYYKNNAKIDGVYSASDMILSDGMTFENNRVKFNSLNDYIKLESVDFDKFNRFGVTYSSDYYTTDDDFIEVIVGDDVNNPVDKRQIRLLPDAKCKDDLNYVFATFDSGMGGKRTVWIKPLNTFGNSEIFQFQLSSEVDTFKGREFDYRCIYGGVFTSSYKGDDPLAESKPAPASTDTGGSYVWGSSWILYENVNVDAQLNWMTLKYASGDKYAGGTVSLRINDPNAEPVATVEIDDTRWGWKETKVRMNKPLPAGRYSFYITGEGSGKNTSINWFKLE